MRMSVPCCLLGSSYTVPDDVIAQVPQTKGYQYAVAKDRVLLVSPANRIVVAAIPDASDATTGRNRHPEAAKP